MISRLLGPGFTLLLSAFLLIASVLLSRAAGNDELFGDFYSALILLNVIGISLLALMSAFQIWRLIGQFRARDSRIQAYPSICWDLRRAGADSTRCGLLLRCAVSQPWHR